MSLLRCGTKAIILFLVLACVISSGEAQNKKKRVIVKVPARVKHIYHHHTKNLHIHKQKPKPLSYDSPRSRPPIPHSGGKKKSPPWRDEKGSYDDDYGYDEYDYGNYGYGGWSDDKGKYKDDRGRWKDDKRNGYDYEAPKRGRWRDDGKRVKGYSGYSKRSPPHKNSRKNPPKKPHRDMYEGAGTAPWPEVKEHDSWHQPRPQGFQQNSRIIPSDQYHDTSIHSTDYPDKQPSNFHPIVVPLDRPNRDRPQTFNRQQIEPQSTNIRPTFERPITEPLHHQTVSDFQPVQPSNFYPVSSDGGDYSHPQQSNFHQSDSFQDPIQTSYSHQFR